MDELILRWLEKISCMHEYEEKYKKVDRWSDAKDDVTYVLICKKCGNIKIIKI